MRATFEKEEPDALYLSYLGWVKTLVPFWRQAAARIAELSGTADEKREKHLRSIDNSLQLMQAWRFKKIKYVQARRKEIDSAISFIRNGALTQQACRYAFAPVCRNLASILRSFFICFYLRLFGRAASDRICPRYLRHCAVPYPLPLRYGRFCVLFAAREVHPHRRPRRFG